MGYNQYKWPKIHGQLGYNKPTYSRGSIYHPIYLSMVHQGGPPLFLGFLGGTIFGIRIHLSYRNQVLGYQSWQRSWCHLRLEWKDAEVARWTTKWDANCHQQWTICDLDGSTWMASQHSQPTPPPPQNKRLFLGGWYVWGGGLVD